MAGTEQNDRAKERRGLAEKGGVSPTPIDIRKLITDRLEFLGRTRYWLAHCGLHDMAPNTVMRYLADEPKHDMTGDNLAQILAVLGLTICVDVVPPQKGSASCKSPSDSGALPRAKKTG